MNKGKASMEERKMEERKIEEWKMEGTEIDLPQMLDCRERRTNVQNELLRGYGRPVISFCMNIPGPIKTNAQIRAAFLDGRTALIEALEMESIAVLQSFDIAEPTGDEWIAAVDADAAVVKELTMEIENRHPLGRLFDMDVIDINGEKLSRPRFRKCLICARQAQECARARAHSVPEMQEAVMKMLARSPANGSK